MPHRAARDHRGKRPCRQLLVRRSAGDDCEHLMSADPLLAVTDLRVTFRTGGMMASFRGQNTEIEAVAGVSFALEKGVTFALVGESGSGKTTLARAVNGLQAAASGSIRFDGQELGGLSDARMKPVRRRMAMMFQDPIGSLSPRLSVHSLL